MNPPDPIHDASTDRFERPRVRLLEPWQIIVLWTCLTGAVVLGSLTAVLLAQRGTDPLRALDFITGSWLSSYPLAAALVLGLGPVTLLLIALAVLAVVLLHRLEQRDVALFALEASETRFRDMTEASSDWLWESDQEHRISFLSARFETIFGISTASVIGRTRLEIMSPETSAEAIERHRTDLNAHRPFRDLMYATRQADGSVRWIRAHGMPRFAADGRFLGYRGTASDITVEREAEERVARLQRHLSHALEAISDGVSLWGPDDRLVLCNERYRRHLFPTFADQIVPGVHAQQVMRLLFEEGTLPAATAEPSKWTRQRLEIRDDLHELSIQHRDGSWLRVRDFITAEGDRFSLFSDITSFKQREADLLELKEAAEIANRAKSEFLTIMSHELRTPLNAIIGFAEILERELFGPLGSPRYLTYSKDIAQSGRHLLSLINDILDLSKAEAGKQALYEDEIPLQRIVDRAMSMMRGNALGAGLTLTLECDEALPVVLVDERRILQVLINLLGNAVKFTPVGGRVTLGATVTSRGIVLQVRDTGIGIRDEDLLRVQEPFVQAENALTRERQGTGLGLPLAKRFSELHGGTIRIESRPSVGTTITVWLPPSRIMSGPYAAPAPTAVPS